MKQIQEINGVFYHRDKKYADERGFLVSILGPDKDNSINFVEHRLSYSRLNVLRGLHGDWSTYKLITLISGHATLVFVDAREDSSTYGNTYEVDLFGLNAYPLQEYSQFLIPPGVLNGHYVWENSMLHYSWSETYKGPENQFGCRWDDPSLDIFRAVKKNGFEPKLSERDKCLPSFNNMFATMLE